ncbi:MAG: glycoside hydrolase family 16 protein [Ignavibacteria bacterium]
MGAKKILLRFLFIVFQISNAFSCCTGNDPGYEWKLTFEDNFDSLDASKWIRTLAYGGRTIWTNKELQWYKDENVSVENGKLKLTAKKESYFGKDKNGEGQFGFTSGMICNSESYTQAYGKWEMRVRFPYRKGYWPAFWLVPTQYPTLPEIDVFEYFGIEKNKIYCNHHWGIDYPNSTNNFYNGNSELFYQVESKIIEGKFDDTWMVWSFECFPDKMIWKLNDKIVYQSDKGIPTAPLYLIANVAVLDRQENNFKVDNSTDPYIMEIDYVRIYKMTPK